MAERVSEIMNREVLSFEAHTPANAALTLLLQMSVTAAPVLDGREHPIGVISLRDLFAAEAGSTVARYMRSPAIVVAASASLGHAARLLDELDAHHLVATDADGRVAGFVSSLDLVRGLSGAPARHPPSFPHYDRASAAVFSDDRRFDPEHVGGVPHAPGIVVVVRGGAGRPERIVAVETTTDLAAWLMRAFSEPEGIAARAGHAITGPAFRYRYSVVDHADRREAMAFALREEAQHAVNVDVLGAPGITPTSGGADTEGKD